MNSNNNAEVFHPKSKRMISILEMSKRTIKAINKYLSGEMK